MKSKDLLEVKTTDLGGRIATLKSKTSKIELPALLPVIHPVKQLVPCQEIRSMGYEAVMTNAYTTFRRLPERASEGIHKIIGFDGTIMTDSGGYQVLEFGSVEIKPEEMANFEEKIGSDIAIILDKPTGLDVQRKFAQGTVRETLQAAERTKSVLTREDMIWTLPVQGGKYLDLVKKSAKASAKLDYDCYALGSPVEVMEQYDFALLVRMILASKKHLPVNRPFHLFGAGHPLILPLAVSLGCDMFDSASYMLYAKQDRYISSSGTIRLEKLDYLPCVCKVCASHSARELKSLPREDRVIEVARHNLYALKLVIEETKQAIWEGRLWEYVHRNSRNHPKALEAFKVAVSASEKDSSVFDVGTPLFKDRGIFVFEKLDLGRPEILRYRNKIASMDYSKRKILLILPETKTKPFLKSKICEELLRILSSKLEEILVTYTCPNFGLVPSELSDIYPVSQCTNAYVEFPDHDNILEKNRWKEIHLLVTKDVPSKWLSKELGEYLHISEKKIDLSKSRVKGKNVFFWHTYRSFKQAVAKL